MAADYTGRRNSSAQILQELEALSETLYQSQASSTGRRTASLALPRTSIPSIPSDDEVQAEKGLNPKPRSRRMSLSPWRSRPKLETAKENNVSEPKESKHKWNSEPASGKKGIWNWKPIRALAHIGMQKLSCVFSVEVVTVQNLPASMNGLRLAVSVRKSESRDGSVQTMPSRVSDRAADFEEMLFIRCHVYFTPGSGTHMRFEPRPFVIYVFAVDAPELNFGRNYVDLSEMIQESIEKSFEGIRVRQWDTSYKLLGKAKGGELVVRLGFQIMEKDGGAGIYSMERNENRSPAIARRQSKASFSVPSPKMSSRAEAWTPSQREGKVDLQGIDDLNLDEPAPLSWKVETKMDDIDIPEFDVVDRGVEIQDRAGEETEQSEDNSDIRSVSSEVVKEVVKDQFHLTRLAELDSIAQQIKSLVSMMGDGKTVKTGRQTPSPKLNLEENKVTREFLQMLEGDVDGNKRRTSKDEISMLVLENDENIEEGSEDEVFLPDLGKGLGCVIQTRNEGYLAAVNPFDSLMARKDTPKLAMQMSKPLVIRSNETGLEFFQKMAATGLEEMTNEISSLMPIDELVGKTAEQVAFEGIAWAIIQGRNKEGASSSAARTIAAVKNLVTAMNTGRQERVSSGIWNVSENPLTIDEILAFSMQKIENMAVDALKIQADIAEEEAPFDVSTLNAKTCTLASAVPIEDWIKRKGERSSTDDAFDLENITLSVVVQLRDPMRQYEAVGGPMIALIHAREVHEKSDDSDDEEKRYKVMSLQVGGVKVRFSGAKNVWDNEKQRLTALQWLVEYGMGKSGKKGKRVFLKGPDRLWSISSRVMADMWLKPLRNPDIKFTM